MAGFRIFGEGAPPASPAKPQVGGKFGAYTLTKLLGEGAMSRVFLGEDGATGEQAALKFLKVEEYPGTPHAVAQFRNRFGREVRLLTRARHPHLVEIRDAVLDGDYPYFVMEHLNGKTLQVRHNYLPALSYASLCRIGQEVASALAAAWEEFRMVHRDLKPRNIVLVGAEETVKVIDLGIAKAIGGETHGSQITTMSGQLIGTPLYMSPEQHLGEKDVDHRTDMYALGLILYELLTFTFPFQGSGNLVLLAAKQAGLAPNWERLASGAPRELIEVVNRLIQPRREKRFADYEALIAALTAAQVAASAKPRQRPGDLIVTDKGTQVMGNSDSETSVETGAEPS